MRKEIQQLNDKQDEFYSKICIVRETATLLLTVNVEPIDSVDFNIDVPNENNYINNVRLTPRFTINTKSQTFNRPVVGSYVIVSWLDKDNAFAHLISETEKFTLAARNLIIDINETNLTIKDPDLFEILSEDNVVISMNDITAEDTTFIIRNRDSIHYGTGTDTILKNYLHLDDTGVQFKALPNKHILIGRNNSIQEDNPFKDIRSQLIIKDFSLYYYLNLIQFRGIYFNDITINPLYRFYRYLKYNEKYKGGNMLTDKVNIPLVVECDDFRYSKNVLDFDEIFDQRPDNIFYTIEAEASSRGMLNLISGTYSFDSKWIDPSFFKIKEGLNIYSNLNTYTNLSFEYNVMNTIYNIQPDDKSQLKFFKDWYYGDLYINEESAIHISVDTELNLKDIATTYIINTINPILVTGITFEELYDNPQSVLESKIVLWINDIVNSIGLETQLQAISRLFTEIHNIIKTMYNKAISLYDDNRISYRNGDTLGILLNDFISILQSSTVLITYPVAPPNPQTAKILGGYYNPTKLLIDNVLK